MIKVIITSVSALQSKTARNTPVIEQAVRANARVGNPEGVNKDSGCGLVKSTLGRRVKKVPGDWKLSGSGVNSVLGISLNLIQEEGRLD